jgi:type I restriction enzyme, S subunit
LLDGLEAVEMKLSSVRIDNMSFRFDAEYFRKEWVENITKLSSIPHVELKTAIKQITGGATPLGANYFTSGVIFLRVQNIMCNYFDLQDVVYINNTQNQEIKRSIVVTGDVLLTITGSYGKSAVIESDLAGANINQHSVKITLNNTLNPYFLSTFFNSKYGKLQSDKTIIGMTRPALDYTIIKNFLIPIFPLQFQQSIETLVKLSHEKLSYSQQLYKEAELILNTELGLIDFNPENHNISIVKLSDSLQKTGRLDAEYYQPKYNSMIDYIKTKTYITLGTIVNIKKSIEPGSDIYCEAGIEFIRVSNITKFGITKTDIHLPLNFLPETELNQLKPKKDTILLSKDGTIGIAYTVKHETKCITSGALLHLAIKDQYINDILPEYLTLVLNSTLVQLQAEQDSGGSIIKHWKPSEIATVLIPLLPITIQTTISDKIKHSFQLRQESTALLEQAKHAVEMMIEG